MTEPVPPDLAVAETKKALEKDPEPLSTICGVDVTRLENMVLTPKPSATGRVFYIDVQGKPVVDLDAAAEGEDDDDEDASAKPDARAKDAGASKTPLVVDPTKALVCAGVLLVMISPDMNDGKVTGAHVTKIDVESVSTPGVYFKKPEANQHEPDHTGTKSHPRRRRRHHHH